MRSRGFTLIELVIVTTVLFIMTMLAWVNMPSVTYFQSYRFANTLLNDLNLTKILSMSQNQRYRMVIGANSYQIQDQHGVAITPPESNSAVINYPTDVSVTPTTTVIFDSLGQPYNAAGTAALTTTLSLTVLTSGQPQMITISPQTGFIQ